MCAVQELILKLDDKLTASIAEVFRSILLHIWLCHLKIIFNSSRIQSYSSIVGKIKKKNIE